VTALEKVGNLDDGTAIIVDWTARQFDTETAAPYPRVETLAEAAARWGPARVIDGRDAWVGLVSEDIEAGPWSIAQRRIDQGRQRISTDRMPHE
jgi:hypothetical protein